MIRKLTGKSLGKSVNCLIFKTIKPKMREIAKEKSNGKLTERIYREFDARFCSLPETLPLATRNSWKFPGIQTGDFG